PVALATPVDPATRLAAATFTHPPRPSMPHGDRAGLLGVCRGVTCRCRVAGRNRTFGDESLPMRLRALLLSVAMLIAGITVTGAVAEPSASNRASAVPNPLVQGPIGGGVHGYPWNMSLFPLRGPGYDYTENEYFYSGTATDLTN